MSQLRLQVSIVTADLVLSGLLQLYLSVIFIYTYIYTHDDCDSHR